MQETILDQIIRELAQYSKKIDANQIHKLAKMCKKSKRIFIAGAGRSGFAARGFANRLMQLGLTTYFVGEPTTPSISKDDLLVIGSGSGNTDSLIANALKSKKQGALLATLTIYPDSKIGKISDLIINIPGETPKNESIDMSTAISLQPMGSLFEQLSWLTYDATIMDLMVLTNETSATMFKRHANLE